MLAPFLRDNGIPSVAVAATVALANAATTARTASTIMKRDAAGNARGNVEQADDPEIALPSYRRFLARTGLTPDEYWRCQTDTGRAAVDGQAHLYSSISSANTKLTGVSTPAVDYMCGGFRGIKMVVDSAFSANVLDPALLSVLYCRVFMVPAYNAATRHLFGRSDTAAATKFRGIIADPGGAKNRLYLQIADASGHAVQLDVANVDLAYGESNIYLVTIRQDKSTNLCDGRISKLGSGLVGTEGSADSSAILTLTGGTAPKYRSGGLPGTDAQGVEWNGGEFGIIGATIQGAGVHAALHSALGFA